MNHLVHVDDQSANVSFVTHVTPQIFPDENTFLISDTMIASPMRILKVTIAIQSELSAKVKLNEGYGRLAVSRLQW